MWSSLREERRKLLGRIKTCFVRLTIYYSHSQDTIFYCFVKTESWSTSFHIPRAPAVVNCKLITLIFETNSSLSYSLFYCAMLLLPLIVDATFFMALEDCARVSVDHTKIDSELCAIFSIIIVDTKHITAPFEPSWVSSHNHQTGCRLSEATIMNRDKSLMWDLKSLKSADTFRRNLISSAIIQVETREHYQRTWDEVRLAVWHDFLSSHTPNSTDYRHSEDVWTSTAQQVAASR